LLVFSDKTGVPLRTTRTTHGTRISVMATRTTTTTTTMCVASRVFLDKALTHFCSLSQFWERVRV
tara:strand:- start:475 stop:669 length:195 start_codon:yes stop_codon:yes gene_type:complete